MDTTLIDTLAASVDTVVACCDTVATTISDPGTSEAVEEAGFIDFILSHWGELVIAALAFIKVVVNITPTEADNKVFGWLDNLINMIVSDRKKAE